MEMFLVLHKQKKDVSNEGSKTLENTKDQQTFHLCRIILQLDFPYNVHTCKSPFLFVLNLFICKRFGSMKEKSLSQSKC